jgi:hypothetical protein
MNTVERLAAQLAEDTMKAMNALGDAQLHYEVAKVIGASSQSLEEAYLTEMRVRLTERQARRFLEQVVKERSASGQ